MPGVENRRNLRFGAFEADLEAAELRKGGVRIALQEQPFRVLAALLERPGQLVTRDELRREIWPADTFGLLVVAAAAAPVSMLIAASALLNPM